MFEWIDSTEKPDSNELYLALISRDGNEYIRDAEYVDDGEGICDDGWQLEEGEKLLGWSDIPECTSAKEYQHLFGFLNWYREHSIVKEDE